jgi:membrane fusion protein (multidrug efflux system)
MIQLGQHVRPGDELFQVTDSEPLIARIFLPETDVVTLVEGREVRITMNADPSVRFAGRIRQISPIVDTATGTVKVTVEAVDPPPAVRPGSFVAIDIVRETRRGALLLPKGAVIRELQASHVFVFDGEKAVKRTVRLGLEEGDQVEALEGVTTGERVVVAGQGGLKDGQAIRVLGDEPAA